ncbi:MAG: AAA family ATPase [Gammaproteobacteria bacterium]|nr:AAA family ATPase [Gammaproteobacteria bacterium]
MKITHLHADNFKSLVNFDLPMAPFSCLVGLNGSGKSTVLQLLDFIAQQFKGDIKNWLESRQWKAADLNSKLTRKSNISLFVTLQFEGVEFQWVAGFNRQTLRCTSERVTANGQVVLKVEEGHYVIYNEQGKNTVLFRGDIAFDYQGSILSQLKASQLTPYLLDLKNFFIQLESLDLLSPELLRRRTREAKGKLGLGGQNLSAFLYELNEKHRATLFAKTNTIYPQLERLKVAPLRSGWKGLSIEEKYGQHHLLTDARHINDGMLRMIAVLAQLLSEHRFLLFDEIENGINPELIEFLMTRLVDSDKQVLVTTHSPMILNYLDDEVAKTGIHYLYKTDTGLSKAIPLFAIPSMAKKLRLMGPGEAFVDTDLSQLADEISGLRYKDK